MPLSLNETSTKTKIETWYEYDEREATRGLNETSTKTKIETCYALLNMAGLCV